MLQGREGSESRGRGRAWWAASLVAVGILGPWSLRGSAQVSPGESTLGPSPGAGGPREDIPGAREEILGSRTGAPAPVLSPNLMQPRRDTFRTRAGRGIVKPDRLQIGETPLYGTIQVPRTATPEGPPNGLTLDDAIERLLRENLDLRTQFFEIPQAQADVLTAGLRANPLLYADTYYIPYGPNFSNRRPGGPTQYDLNITYPLDLSRKRRARVQVACRARKVLEAQYQDAVRLQIDNLYTALVEVLAARENVLFAREGTEGLRRALEVARAQRAEGVLELNEVNVLRVQLESSEIGLGDAIGELRVAKQALAALLNIPPDEVDALEIRGRLRVQAPPLPPVSDLIRLALDARPDLAAYRLGVARAEADVRLARAERFSDAYLLYAPFVYQNNAPFRAQSATSWSVGMTIPLPVYNRNQGNIERARLNLAQTQTGLAALSRKVVAEVQQAYQRYELTRSAVEQIERDLLPAAREVRENTDRLFRHGETTVFAFLEAQRNSNEIVRQYRETLVRHRRSMLNLNTAVGMRLLP